MDNLSTDDRAIGEYEPLLLLILTATALAFTVILSRLAANAGAPMLWFLCLSMAIAGLMLSLLSLSDMRGSHNWRRTGLYCLGAGALLGFPNAIAYLAVIHVGAGFVSLVYAFPLLLTYILALGLGMEGRCWKRMTGVVVALGGGLIFAASKYSGMHQSGGDVEWVIIAGLIPIGLAIGNIYRTRFWPKGESPRLLASGTLLLASALIAPFAIALETTPDSIFVEGDLRGLLAINAAAMTVQTAMFFRLQKVAGPVYLGQLGTVAAAIGAPAAVVLFNESLPGHFLIAVCLTLAGIGLFQAGVVRTGNSMNTLRRSR